MHWMLLLAIVLLVLWVVARILGWVIGAALNLLWILALVLLAIWIFQKIRAKV